MRTTAPEATHSPDGWAQTRAHIGVCGRLNTSGFTVKRKSSSISPESLDVHRYCKRTVDVFHSLQGSVPESRFRSAATHLTNLRPVQ